MNSALLQDQPEAEHRPRGVMLWLQVFIVGFLLGMGVLIVAASIGSQAAPAAALAACFFFALGGFFLLILVGFRSQHLTVRAESLSVALPPLGSNFVFPWTLRRVTLKWSEVRALDVKHRDIGAGPQRVYVLRTATAGDLVFFWPQWPDAEAIAEEILRRSGAGTSTEDMSAPAPADAQTGKPAEVSLGEKLARGCGWVMLITSIVLGLLCLIGMLGAKPEERGGIARGLMVLGIAAAAAEQLRRYRRIR